MPLFRFFILLFLTTAFAFADGITGNGNGFAEFPVYVYTDLGIFDSALNSIAMMVDSGLVNNIMTIGATISLVFAGLAIAAKNSSIAFKRTVIIMGLFGATIFTPSTVYLVDQRLATHADLYVSASGTVAAPPAFNIGTGTIASNGFVKIDNVPWGLGFIMWSTNALAIDATNAIETVFQAIDPEADKLAYSATGLNGQYNNLMSTIENASFTALAHDNNGSEWNQKTTAYLKGCIFDNYAIVAPSQTLSVISSGGDMITNLNYTNFTTNGGVDIVNVEGYGDMTCKDLYDFMVANKDIISSKLADLKFGGGLKTSEVGKGYVSKFGFYADANLSEPKHSLINLAMAKITSDVAAKSSIGLTSSQSQLNSITARMSELQVQANGVQMGYSIAKLMPILVAYLTVITWIVFPFVAASAMLAPGNMSLKIINGYFFSNLGLAMIHPALALTQGITNTLLSTRIYEKIQEAGTVDTPMISLEKLPSYYSEIATMAGISGWLALAAVLIIPTLVITGGGIGVYNAILGQLGGMVSNPSQAGLQYEREKAASTAGQTSATSEYSQAFMEGLNQSAATGGQLKFREAAAGDNKMINDYVRGIERSAMQGLASTAGAGSVSGISDSQIMQNAANSGAANFGSQMAQGSAQGRSGIGAGTSMDNSYFKGIENQTGRQIAQTSEYGKMSFGDAQGAGALDGKTAVAQDGVRASFNRDLAKMQEYLQGVRNKAREGLDATATDGRMRDEEKAGAMASVAAAADLQKKMGEYSAQRDINDPSKLNDKAADLAFQSGAGAIMSAINKKEALEKRTGLSYSTAMGLQGAFAGASEAGQLRGQIHAGQTNIGLAAQSSVESGTAAAIGSINTMGGGEKGVHNLATLAGKQAQVQTGISSQMMGAFGVSGLTAAGFASQAASTKSTLDVINKEFGGSTSDYIQQASTIAVQKAGEAKSDIAGRVKGGYMSSDGILSASARTGISELSEKASASTIRSGEVLSDDKKTLELGKRMAEDVARNAAMEEFQRSHSIEKANQAAVKAVDRQTSEMIKSGGLAKDSAGYKVDGLKYEDGQLQFSITEKGENKAGSLAQMIGYGEANMVTGMKGVAIGSQTVRMQGDAISTATDTSSSFSTGTSYKNTQEVKAGIDTNLMSAASMGAGLVGEAVVGALAVGSLGMGANAVYQKINDIKEFKDSPLGKLKSGIGNKFSGMWGKKDSLPDTPNSFTNPNNSAFDGTPNGKYNSAQYKPNEPQYNGSHNTPPNGFTQLQGDSELAKRGFAVSSMSDDILQQSAGAVNQNQGLLSRVGSAVGNGLDTAKGFVDDAAKYAGRKLPGGIGTAISAGFAAEQAMAGDRAGAAMTAVSGAVAAVPLVGTVASIAIDGTQMVMKETGALDKINQAMGSSMSQTVVHQASHPTTPTQTVGQPTPMQGIQMPQTSVMQQPTQMQSAPMQAPQAEARNNLQFQNVENIKQLTSELNQKVQQLRQAQQNSEFSSMKVDETLKDLEDEKDELREELQKIKKRG